MTKHGCWPEVVNKSLCCFVPSSLVFSSCACVHELVQIDNLVGVHGVAV
jgi:hypothetical protein